MAPSRQYINKEHQHGAEQVSLQQFKGPSQSQQTSPKQSSEPRKLLSLHRRLFLEDETVVREQGKGEIHLSGTTLELWLRECMYRLKAHSQASLVQICRSVSNLSPFTVGLAIDETPQGFPNLRSP
jgi:hypothetical protein